LKVVAAFVTNEIEAVGEGALKPMHSGDQVGLGSFEGDVEVVAHDDEGVEELGGFLTGGKQAVLESGARFIFLEEITPVVAAVDEVVNGTRENKPSFSCHEATIARGAPASRASLP
jgi:hypothetical protein